MQSFSSGEQTLQQGCAVGRIGNDGGGDDDQCHHGYDYERAVAHGCGRPRTYDVTHLVGAQLYAVVSVSRLSAMIVFHLSFQVQVGF